MTALFTVMSARAQGVGNIPRAGALGVLQVIGTVERTEPGRGIRPSEIARALDIHRSGVTDPAATP